MTASVVFEALRWLAATSLGVFAGGMLTEGGVLVPYWRSLTPREFLAWYGAHGHRLQGFFGPLTYVAGVLALAAAVGSVWGGHPHAGLSVAAAGAMLAAVATFFVYFGKANASFAHATIPEDAVPAELARWGAWHWARTVLSFVALATAMLALR